MSIAVVGVLGLEVDGDRNIRVGVGRSDRSQLRLRVLFVLVVQLRSEPVGPPGEVVRGDLARLAWAFGSAPPEVLDVLAPLDQYVSQWGRAGKRCIVVPELVVVIQAFRRGSGRGIQVREGFGLSQHVHGDGVGGRHVGLEAVEQVVARQTRAELRGSFGSHRVHGA